MTERRQEPAADNQGVLAAPVLRDFLAAVAQWAQECEDVLGLALVGSYAHDAAHPDSDVDILVLSTDPAKLVSNCDWAERFGEIRNSQREQYGVVSGLRVFYANGLEVEFGFSRPAWTSIPLDPGTRRVLADGVRILYDPNGLLAAAQAAAAQPA